jgi:glucose/arabinose dehydrogenase
MGFESGPGTVTGMPDDKLATAAVSLAISELEWTPDVAPAVMDRISRDAVAYPEQFDRRPVRAEPPPPPMRQRSAGRTLGRLAVFAGLVVIIVALVTFAASANATAASTDLRIELQEVASGFDRPILVTHAGDGSDRLYVVEQTGRIWLLTDEGVPATPFLDVSGAITAGGERGLLGLAFHPGYAENGRFFVNYTREEDGATVVSEFFAVDGVVDPASQREILVIGQPFGNHNAGDLAFDADGMLLVPTGDGGSGGDPQGHGQRPDSLLGKLLRLDVDSAQPYVVPPDNGFASTDGYRPEIHAKGLRNPWRISVDPDGGHIYIGDVGQSRFEEISVLPGGVGGQSFGWNEVEGPECYVDGCDLAAHAPPAAFYSHDEGCSVTGGHVYRGQAQPGLAGIYLFGDVCSGTIWGADAASLVAGQADPVPIGEMRGTLVSFGVDGAGELYAVDHGGSIHHVVTEAP